MVFQKGEELVGDVRRQLRYRCMNGRNIMHRNQIDSWYNCLEIHHTSVVVCTILGRESRKQVEEGFDCLKSSTEREREPELLAVIIQRQPNGLLHSFTSQHKSFLIPVELGASLHKQFTETSVQLLTNEIDVHGL